MQNTTVYYDGTDNEIVFVFIKPSVVNICAWLGHELLEPQGHTLKLPTHMYNYNSI